VSGCERLFGDAIEIGHAVKRDILRETGLVASVGVASSKFVAKLASDLDKPDGFRVIRPEEQREVLDPLSVSKIFGVGPRTAKRLEVLGVHTIGDLAGRPRAEVAREFGATGAWIHDLAHGIDSRRVTPRRDEKSLSHERTFPEDVEDREELRLRLFEFCEELAFRLRDQGLRGKTVALKARYWNIKTVTRTRTLAFPTNLGPRLYSVARELLARVPPGPMRLLGVQVSNLDDVRAPMQGQLWSLDGPPAEPDQPARLEGGRTAADPGRLERATAGMDRLRRKFGRQAVVPASLLGRDRVAGRDGSDGDAGADDLPG
jgi:DNA polymerase-4